MKGIQRTAVLLLIGSLLALLPVSAQDDWQSTGMNEAFDALRKINEKMMLASSIEMTVEQKLIDLSANKEVYSGSGFFRRRDSLYIHSQVMGIETIQNQNYRLVIDTANHTLMVSNVSPLTPYSDIAQMELYFKSCPVKQVRKKTSSDGITTINILFKKQEGYLAESMTFSYNSEMLLTEYRLVLGKNASHPDAPGRSEVIVRYGNFKLNQNLSKKQFSCDHIVTIKNGEFIPVEKYSTYSIRNTYQQ